MPPFGRFCPRHALYDSPTLPLFCLPVCPLTNGPSPQFFLSFQSHWLQAKSPGTLKTHPLMEPIGPEAHPQSLLHALVKPCTHHTSNPLRVRGHSVVLISNISAHFSLYCLTLIKRFNSCITSLIT